LDLGAAGGIEVLYPLPGVSEALVPGRSLEIGFRKGQELEVFLPPELPFVRGLETGSEITHFKLLLSTAPADFDSLFRSELGVSARRTGPRGRLELHLATSLGQGHRLRDVRRREAVVDDWAALTYEVCIRRRRTANP
jgi:hypothetical protein